MTNDNDELLVLEIKFFFKLMLLQWNFYYNSLVRILIFSQQADDETTESWIILGWSPHMLEINPLDQYGSVPQLLYVAHIRSL